MKLLRARPSSGSTVGIIKSGLTKYVVVSGSHFKATLHKVVEPPGDQRNEQRLSLVLFNGSREDMRLKSATGEYLVLSIGPM